MFPLSTQISFSCLQAYEGVHRLRGEMFSPSWHRLLEDGRNGHNDPGDLLTANTRISDTLTFLEAVDVADINQRGDRPLPIDLPDGRIFDMTRSTYVRDWALPQFYFHVNTAYAILRANGLPLGKADYVQHAFRYLRA